MSDKLQCVAGVALQPPDRVLLIRHRGRGSVEIPGGKIRSGETHAEAVIREIREETSLAVTAVGLCLGTYVGEDFECHFYSVEVAPGEPHPGDDALAAWWGEASETCGVLVEHNAAMIVAARIAHAKALASVRSLFEPERIDLWLRTKKGRCEVHLYPAKRDLGLAWHAIVVFRDGEFLGCGAWSWREKFGEGVAQGRWIASENRSNALPPSALAALLALLRKRFAT